ncbi:MAG: hypothetical protein OJF51_003870 [Nitrospira sp.]|nr:MAG: hypothetical protein OJF51_003870 [Nitrospira sp.]
MARVLIYWDYLASSLPNKSQEIVHEYLQQRAEKYLIGYREGSE